MQTIQTIKPREKDDLAVKAGDLVSIIYHQDNGWSIGYAHGKRGFIPLEYLRPIIFEKTLILFHPDVKCFLIFGKLYCPIEYSWKIREAKLMDMAQEQSHREKLFTQKDDSDSEKIVKFASDTKEVPSMPTIKYQLQLQVNSTSGNKRFSLFLHVPYQKEAITSKIHGKYAFFVKSANFISQFDTVFTKIDVKRGDEICSVDQMFCSKDSERKFIIDGMFTVQMKGIFIIEQNEMPKVIMESNFLSKKLWERDDWDFEVIVDNEGKIMVHKIIFDTMLTSSIKTTTKNSIVISDFALKTVQAAIEFFYCQNIFQTLTINDALKLLQFAIKYDVNDLQLKLDTFFSYHLSPSTVCQLANGSIATNYSKLRNICMDFLMTCNRHSVAIKDTDTLDKKFAADFLRNVWSSASD